MRNTMPSGVGSVITRSNARAARSASAAVAVVDEHDVDVARVVQLDPAELAHADHGHRHRGRRDRERDAEARLRDARQLGADGRAGRRCRAGRVPAMRTIWRCFQRRSSALGSSWASRRPASSTSSSTSSECAAPPLASIAIAVLVAFEHREQRVRRDAHRHERVEELRIGSELVAEAADALRRAAPARPARSAGRPTGRAPDGRARCRRPSSTDECRALDIAGPSQVGCAGGRDRVP